jgi:hypothetical protein
MKDSEPSASLPLTCVAEVWSKIATVRRTKAVQNPGNSGRDIAATIMAIAAREQTKAT